MKVLSSVGDAMTAKDLAGKLDADADETRRVLQGLALADLIERQVGGRSRSIVVLDGDASAARRLRQKLDEQGGRYTAKIVRDQLAVQLLLKRSKPDALIMPLDTDAEREFAVAVHKHLKKKEIPAKWIGLHANGDEENSSDWKPPIPCNAVVSRPCDADQILGELDRIFNNGSASSNGADDAADALASMAVS